jgi:hypothetical protein
VLDLGQFGHGGVLVPDQVVEHGHLGGVELTQLALAGQAPLQAAQQPAQLAEGGAQLVGAERKMKPAYWKFTFHLHPPGQPAPPSRLSSCRRRHGP